MIFIDSNECCVRLTPFNFIFIFTNDVNYYVNLL